MSNFESGARLRAFVVSQKISPKDLAEALCISPQALNNWFNRGVPEERAEEVRGAAAALAMHVPFNQLRNLLGELYQILGTLDAGAKVLDQVSAAIHGLPLPHETLLPYYAEPGTGAGAGGIEPSLLGYINVPTLDKLLRGISYPTTICSAIPSRINPDPTPDESWAVPIYVMRRQGEQL